MPKRSCKDKLRNMMDDIGFTSDDFNVDSISRPRQVDFETMDFSGRDSARGSKYTLPGEEVVDYTKISKKKKFKCARWYILKYLDTDYRRKFVSNYDNMTDLIEAGYNGYVNLKMLNSMKPISTKKMIKILRHKEYEQYLEEKCIEKIKDGMKSDNTDGYAEDDMTELQWKRYDKYCKKHPIKDITDINKRREKFFEKEEEKRKKEIVRYMENDPYYREDIYNLNYYDRALEAARSKPRLSDEEIKEINDKHFKKYGYSLIEPNYLYSDEFMCSADDSISDDDNFTITVQPDYDTVPFIQNNRTYGSEKIRKALSRITKDRRDVADLEEEYEEYQRRKMLETPDDKKARKKEEKEFNKAMKHGQQKRLKKLLKNRDYDEYQEIMRTGKIKVGETVPTSYIYEKNGVLWEKIGNSEPHKVDRDNVLYKSFSNTMPQKKKKKGKKKK